MPAAHRFRESIHSARLLPPLVPQPGVLLLVGKEIVRQNIGPRVEQDAVARLAVTAGAADLLRERFQRARHVAVNHEPDVALVDAHTERNGRHNDKRAAFLERFLALVADVVLEPCVIGLSVDSVLAKRRSQIVGILPGPVNTHFDEVAVASIPDTGEDSPYYVFKQNLAKSTREMLDPKSTGVLEPEDVAKVIVEAATADSPKDRYHVGMMSKAYAAAYNLMPDKIWDAAVSRMIPVDEKK